MLAGVRRALLGGTFDPPHLAHLVAAEAAYRQLGVEVVTFLPAGAPWQKAGAPVTPAAHRWEMTRLAVAGVGYFEADDREVHRDGWTYTAETLGTFDPADEIVLVLGADAAAGVPTWHRSGDVLARARVAVAPRPGTDHTAVEAALGSGVAWLDMPSLEISGTGIRRMASAGRSIRFLVREGVWEYAVRHDLYPPGG
jgi:nicotinate-nucleotide adenylyltransferase